MGGTSKKLLLAILVLGLVLPLYEAHALVGSLLFGDVNTFFASTLAIIFTTLGKLLAAMVTAMGWALNLRIYTNIPVIEAGWKIFRDFANMLFIIALVVMAYGTIFSIQGYDFRSLIPRFLIAAFLINFSLVIGGLIIDGTQVLNNTFLNAMGDIAGRLGQGLNPADLFPPGTDVGSAEAISSQVGSSIITLFFSIFLVFTFLISVSVPLVFAFVRIPILWALLIVSPAVWLLSILPATKSVYDKWWHQFLGWNLFLPYYLFFLYFALFLLSKKNEVLQGLGQTFVSDSLVGLSSNFTFGLLFYYILIAVFLIGGTKVAMSAGTFSGTGIVSVAKWARGGTAGILRKTRVPYLGSYEGWEEATKAKRAQFGKEGVRIGGITVFGGKEAREREIARRKEFFGVPGEKADTYLAQANERVSRLDRMPLSQAREQAGAWEKRGSEIEKIAAKKWQARKGYLGAEQMAQTIRDFGGESNRIAIDFAKDAKTAIDRWSYEQKTQALENELVKTLPELENTIIMSLINAKQVRNPDQLKNYITRFENDPEGLNALLEAVDKAGINMIYERGQMLAEMASDIGQGEFTQGMKREAAEKVRSMMALKLKDMKAYGREKDPVKAFDQLIYAVKAVGEDTGNARSILNDVRKSDRALWYQYIETKKGGSQEDINRGVIKGLTDYFITTSPSEIRENNSEFWTHDLTKQALNTLDVDALRSIGEGAPGIARQEINRILQTKGEPPLGTFPLQQGNVVNLRDKGNP